MFLRLISVMVRMTVKMDQMKVTFMLVPNPHSDVPLDNGYAQEFQKDALT